MRYSDKLNSATLTLFIVMLMPVITTAADRGAEDGAAEKWVEVKRKEIPKISAELLASRYPAGKQWTGVASFRANGTVTRANWVKVTSEVVYVSRTAIKWTVIENRGDTVRFKVEIPESSTTRIVSDRKVRLRNLLSESPILELAWDEVGEDVIKSFPAGPVIYRFGKLISKVDPGFEESMTKLAAHLKKWGVDITAIHELEIESKIKKIQGSVFELDYVNGFGVERIRRISGAVTPDSELRAIASGLGPVVDAHLFPSVNQDIGDTWTVSAENWSGLMGLDPFTETSGSVDLRYENDALYSGERVRRASITGGELRFGMNTGARRYETVLRPKMGEVDFDHADLLVRRAVGDWSVQAFSFSKDHLLFSARVEGDWQVVSRYEGWLTSK